jgi:hypothetical protein
MINTIEKEKGGRRGDGGRWMRKKGGWGRNGWLREEGRERGGEGKGGRESVSAYVAPIREPHPPFMC